MKFLEKAWPILAAILLGAILIVVDICTKGNVEATDEFDEESYEEYAKQLVESSTIKVNDTIYYGVFANEEISELPEGYTLCGAIEECVGLDGELVNNLSSNSITEGYEVYTSTADPHNIYLKVSTEEDDYDSFIIYNDRQ